MIRVRGAVVIRHVAGRAGITGQTVGSATVMAVGTLPWRYGVHAGEREPGRRMIKLAVSPLHGVVALFAGGRESRVQHRRGRVVVIGLMARHARGHRNVVVVVNVAVGAQAGWHRVRTRQRERRLRVIERRRQPGRGRVTCLASLRKSSGHVVRIGRALEILQVARHAGGSRQIEIIVGVAIGAGTRRHTVRPSQREIHRIVIETRRCPRHRGVALLAGLRETAGHVTRVVGVLEIGQMAGDAGGARQIVVIVGVAVRTGSRRHHVRTCQRESGRIVIELRIQPVVGAVASLTSHRELARHVIRIRGAQEVGLMAGVALRRHRLEVAICPTLVTGIAVDGGVRSGEREPIIVVLNLLHCDCPAAHGVALLAIRSQLPPVDIGVTILAMLAHIIKDRLNVTLHAGHGLVHAA